MMISYKKVVRILSILIIGPSALTEATQLSPVAEDALKELGADAVSQWYGPFLIYSADAQLAATAGSICTQAVYLADKLLGASDTAHEPSQTLTVFLLSDRSWLRLARRHGLRAEGTGFQLGSELFVAAGKRRADLTHRLAHEIAHNRVKGWYGDQLPLWLEEGLAGMIGWDCAVAIRKAKGWEPRRPSLSESDRRKLSLAYVTSWTNAYPPRPADALVFARASEALVRAMRARLGSFHFARFLWATAAGPDPWDAVLRKEYDFDSTDFARLEGEMRRVLSERP